MPANRNDVTHKPIYETTSRDVEKWAAIDPAGEYRTIWSRTETGARQYADEMGWKFIARYKGKIQGNEL